MKIILIVASMFPIFGYCCSWQGDPTGGIPYEERVTKYIEEAEYIFLAEIEEYEWRPFPNSESDRSWHYHKIKPIEVFKGNVSKSFVYWPATSCHQIFKEIGSKFVLFGSSVEGSIQFHLLSGTTNIGHANEIGLVKKLRAIPAAF